MKKLILTAFLVFVLTHFFGYAQNPPKSSQTILVSQKLEKSNPDWGCPIAGSSGIISFNQSDKTFIGTIEVKGLTPNHRYILCINGKVNHQSNNLLKQAGCEEYKGEYKCDFFDFETDAKGYCKKEFEKSLLPKGNYDVKIFIKDKANSYCATLYRDIQIEFVIK